MASNMKKKRTHRRDVGASSSNVAEKNVINLDDLVSQALGKFKKLEISGLTEENKRVVKLDKPAFRKEAFQRFKRVQISGLTVQGKKEPAKNPTPRFQLFSAKVHVDKYGASNTKCFLFGYISVTDPSAMSEEYVWLPEDKDAGYYDPDWCEHVWVPEFCPEDCYVLLFDRVWCELLPIINNGFLNSLKHPSTDQSVPFSNTLHLLSELFVHSKEDNLLFQVSNEDKAFNLSDQAFDTLCTHIMKGVHGSVELSYIVLKDAVDAHLEIKFRMLNPRVPIVCGDCVSVKIIAYYGGENDYGCRRDEGYSLTLLNTDSVVLLNDTIVSLNTSLLAVPINGSLLIHAFIKETSGSVIMDDYCEFHAKREASSNDRIKASNCCLEVNVNWKDEAAT